VVPVLRPKAADADKQIEELEEAIGEVLEQRRKQPLYGPPEGLAGHFVATSRLINRKAVLRPAEGRSRVFLVGHAERLVPQEASPDAANALLKLLEEPPDSTWFILTAADPEAVLPTIRSRAVRLGLGRLSDDEVRSFLANSQPEVRGEALERRVRRAEGAIGRALDDSETEEKATRAAMALLESARTRSPAGWEMALKQTPFSARGEFTGTLDAMAQLLVEATRPAEAGGRAGSLSRIPRERLVEALEKVEEARELAQNNVNPQLILAVLNQDLAEVL
jgi:DNA polymerase-3 subunit delta'